MSHRDFEASSAPYAAMGYFLSETARLEVAVDDFIFSLNKHHPAWCARNSKRFPRQLNAKRLGSESGETKLGLWLASVCAFKNLRSEPLFGDGSLDLAAAYFSIIEQFDVRNALAHGAVDCLATREASVCYTAWRYVRGSNGLHSDKRYRVGSFFLASLTERGRVFRHYFQRLVSVLEGSENWEGLYQEDKVIRANREVLNDLASYLGVSFPDFSNLERVTLKLVLENSEQGSKK